jgi:hypothetical protein
VGDTVVDADPFLEACWIAEVGREFVEIESALFRKIVVAFVAMRIEECDELGRWDFVSSCGKAAKTREEGADEIRNGGKCFQRRTV